MSIPSWGRPFRGPNQDVTCPFTGQMNRGFAVEVLGLGRGGGLEGGARPEGLLTFFLADAVDFFLRLEALDGVSVGAGLTQRTESAPGMKIFCPTTTWPGSLMRLALHTFFMFT